MSAGDVIGQAVSHPKTVTGTAITAQAAPVAADAGLMDSILAQGLSILGVVVLCLQVFFMVRKDKMDKAEADRKIESDRLYQQKMNLEIEVLRNEAK